MSSLRLRQSNNPHATVSSSLKRVFGSGIITLMLAGILFYATNHNTGITPDDVDGDGITNDLDLDDDNDGIPDSEEGSYVITLVNGDFEELDPSKATHVWGKAPKRAMALFESDIPGWNTSASNNRIEVWESGFGRVTSHSNGHHAEINAFSNAELYQDVHFDRPGVIRWAISHRARKGIDSMNILIGPAGNQTEVARVGTDTKAWKRYSGSYTLTEEGTVRFSFNAISTGSGRSSIGNFIDNFEVYIEEDFDGDGIVNSQDLDSDNDGISDIIEAGGTDPDGDGRVAYATPGDPTTMVDSDGDGLADAVDTKVDNNGSGTYVAGTAWILPDTDGDGRKDFTDIDADDDGIVDNTEAMATYYYVAPVGHDEDHDGQDDAYDIDCQPCGVITGTAVVPINSDLDINPDYIDIDSDNDAVGDIIEGHDTNGDGVVDNSDAPLANTGTTSDSSDIDADGLLDGFDNNIVANDPTNGIDPLAYPKAEGTNSDQDWRYSNVKNLPVEWLFFEAEPVAGATQLKWATSSEQNADYFNVERSIDGTFFTSLGTVRAAGNSQTVQNYKFTDENVNNIKGQTIYYRLKQVDFNGANEYSQVVEFSPESRFYDLDFSVSSSGNEQVLTVKASRSLQFTGTVNVLTLNGKIVTKKAIATNEREVQIQTAGWTPGTYIFSLTEDMDQVARKVQIK
ncbi:MAG: hypothetical protein AAFW00_25340 [Bacteroidota bacterium]